MPRRKVVWSSRKRKPLPPGVQAAVVADQLAGGRSLAETGAKYGIDPTSVKRLAANVSAIDREEVTRIAAGLPRLYSLIAAEFGLAALDQLRGGDPSGATKLVFGSKLATEAGRLAAPAADKPGVQILAFIGSLGGPGAPTPAPPARELAPVVELAPAGGEADPEPEPASPDAWASTEPVELESGP